jgi:hypothetical protein
VPFLNLWEDLNPSTGRTVIPALTATSAVAAMRRRAGGRLARPFGAGLLTNVTAPKRGKTMAADRDTEHTSPNDGKRHGKLMDLRTGFFGYTDVRKANAGLIDGHPRAATTAGRAPGPRRSPR